MIEIVTENHIFERQIWQILHDGELGLLIKSEPVRINNNVNDIRPNVATIYITDALHSSLMYEQVFIISDDVETGITLPENIKVYSYGRFDADRFAKDFHSILTKKLKASKTVMTMQEKDGYIETLNAYIKDTNRSMSEARSEQEKIMQKSCKNAGYEEDSYYQAYNVIPGDIIVKRYVDGKFFIMIGDVTNHGYSKGCYAASIYSMAYVYFDICSKMGINLTDWVRFVWKSANTYKSSWKNTQISATALFVEISGNSVKFINCGHCRPIIIRNDEAEIVESIPFKPIGDSIAPDSNIPPFNEDKHRFSESDGLLLYTDGITDMFNSEYSDIRKSVYSEERLFKTVQSNLEKNWSPKELIYRIIQDVDTFSAGGNMEKILKNRGFMIPNAKDDISIYCIKRHQDHVGG